MVVIVAHKESKQKYLLVGTGFGICPSLKASPMFGTLLPTGEKDKEAMAAVCDDSGKIEWIHSDQIEIVKIDGRSPSELL